MKHIPLDIYDEMPADMKKYISNYGWHFNKRAYEYAVKYMYKASNVFNKKEAVKAYSKEDVDKLLEANGISLKTKIMHDYVYVATMCKADYLGSSIDDEKHLAMFVKDTIDDVDASNETTFRRWVATMVGNGIPVDWSEIV